VLLVAELSANHGQKREIALRTLEAAAKAGADAVKLQTYTPDTLTLRSDAELFVVRSQNEWAGRTLHDLYSEAMTPWEWHAELMQAATSLGLQCFSTPFDATAVAFLEGLGVPAHKVASFELTDLPLVEEIARTGKPMIVSTGMASLGEIEAAISVCREAGNDQIALLRCVSSYPARAEMMGLASLEILRSFGTVVGVSDHTREATVAIAAVALGAKVVEKHFILDRSMGGPDSFFSLDPGEFSALAKAVREAEKAVGSPRFGPTEDERASTGFRRSLFVARQVTAGDVLTCDDVRSVRPANGLDPRHLPEVLGRRASCDLSAAKPLTWEDVGRRPVDELRLRPATPADSERLLGWRNDPLTRAMSIEQREVTREEHAVWLARSVDQVGRVLLVAEAKGQPVGTVRLDAHDQGVWEVSLTVGAEHRGKGHAAAMLRVVEGVARSRGAIRLTAVIRADNAPSIRAFKRAGYYGFSEAGPVMRCVRRIVPYGGSWP